jgi:hypothetical protein
MPSCESCGETVREHELRTCAECGRRSCCGMTNYASGDFKYVLCAQCVTNAHDYLVRRAPALLAGLPT